MTEQEFVIIENMLELMKNFMSSNNFSVARWHHICKDTKLEQNCLFTAL